MWFELTWFWISELLRPIFSTLELLLCTYFWKFCCLQVFHFHLSLRHAIPWRAPISKMRHSPDGVEVVEAPLLNNLWDYASNGSWWVHTYSVTTTPPKYSSSRFSTTLHTDEGDVLVTVSRYGNCSALLVGVNDYLVTRRIFQMRSIMPKGLWDASYHIFFIPFSYNQQQDSFYPSAVGVRLLVRHQFIRGIFPKQSGQ